MHQNEPEFGKPEFLGWCLLVELKRQRNEQISRSKFLKLCCIVDRRLQRLHDYEVGLPRYWYMYGELANEHEFTGRFYNAPQAIGWDGQQYIPKQLGAEEFAVSQEEQELIVQEVRSTVTEFGTENVEKIKQHQYQEHAENRFINLYSEFRWVLNTIDLGRQRRLGNYVHGESNEEYVRRKLDAMLEAYPEDEARYDEMKSLYLRWDDTVRLMLERGVEYSRIAEFLDDFIQVLSKVVLRFNYNQQIPDERLTAWDEDATEEKSKFASRLRKSRESLLSDRSRSSELDGVSGAYSQTINKQIDELLAQE